VKTPLEQLDEEVQDFLSRHFGKRDDETLGQAMERVAMQENPAVAAFRKAKK
jgi:hypothetical protein